MYIYLLITLLAMEKRGEVQKGFVVIILLILGVAVLASYLNNDGTGYASGRLRESSGMVSPPHNNC